MGKRINDKEVMSYGILRGVMQRCSAIAVTPLRLRKWLPLRNQAPNHVNILAWSGATKKKEDNHGSKKG